MKFKPSCRIEADQWITDGEKISDPEKLKEIRKVLEKDGPILVEHKFHRGGRGPRTIAFDDFEEFITYLIEKAKEGDKINVWSLWPFMRDTQPLAHGKCPAEDGAVPTKGAY